MSMGLRSKPIGFSMGFGYAENPCFFNGVAKQAHCVSAKKQTPHEDVAFDFCGIRVFSESRNQSQSSSTFP